MFEPENDVERALVRASTDRSARPDFVRALLDTDVFIALVSADGGPIPLNTDGQAVAEGARLTLATARRGDETLIPFFSAPSRARAWIDGDHVLAPDKVRMLFERHRDAAFVLNPCSDYGKEFTPMEVARLLAGDFEEPVEPVEPATLASAAPTPVLLGHPKERPEALIAALARELAPIKSVRGAWLMRAHRANQPEPNWMLGVDHTGDWAEIVDALRRAIAGDVLQGLDIEAMPLDAGEFAVTLRTGIPVIAKERSFLDRFR